MLDRIGFRRHPGACRYYREDWNVPDALYRCYCLLEMPPTTAEEQQRCMTAQAGCWRFTFEKTYTTGRRQRAGVAE